MRQDFWVVLFIILYSFFVGHFNMLVGLSAGIAMLFSYVTYGGNLGRKD